MATKGEITAGWNKLYKLWDIKGGCETCRYHGLLLEHDLCDDEKLWINTRAFLSSGVLRIQITGVLQ